MVERGANPRLGPLLAWPMMMPAMISNLITELLHPCVGHARCPICDADILAVRTGTGVELSQPCPHAVSFFAQPEMRVAFAGDGE